MQFVWADSGSHPNATLRNSVSLELSDYTGCRRHSLSTRLDISDAAEGLRKWYAETLSPVYVCPELHQSKTTQIRFRRTAFGFLLGLFARWALRQQEGNATPLSSKLIAPIVALALTMGSMFVSSGGGWGASIASLYPQDGQELLLVCCGIAAAGALAYLPALALAVSHVAKAAALALPAAAAMFPDQTSEALARAQCAAGLCCDGGA